MAEARRIYAIDSDNEAERLERQAELAGIEDHLKQVPLDGVGRILDVGCGSGSMTRALARALPEAEVVGVDLRDEYLTPARELAAEAGLENIEFVEGDAFSLPFEAGGFDLVWNKYLLQWLHDPRAALVEMKRVTRPGGQVICCTFDGFMLEHFPPDAAVQAFVDKVMPDVCDSYAGRKVAPIMQGLGFDEIDVAFEPDRLFNIVGRIDGELLRNLEVQWRAAFPYVVKIWGDEDEAARLVDRLMGYFQREDTASACALYFVRGRVPS